MKTVKKEYEICSEFKASEANNAKEMLEKNGKFVDNWYVYTTPDVYKKLFNKKIQGKEKLPWKRKVVRIYSEKTKCSVYRIWRGTFRTVLSKDILYVDRDAKYILTNTEDKANIILCPSNKFLYYWNHFAPEIRAPFKLGLISFLVSLISLILGIISLIPFDKKKSKEPNNIEIPMKSSFILSQDENENLESNKIKLQYPETTDIGLKDNKFQEESDNTKNNPLNYEKSKNEEIKDKQIKTETLTFISEEFSLDDDEVLTGRTLVSYSYGNVKEREVYSWVEMFTDVIKQIYDEDSSQIRILAADKTYEYIVLSNTEKQGDWFKID